MIDYVEFMTITNTLKTVFVNIDKSLGDIQTFFDLFSRVQSEENLIG